MKTILITFLFCTLLSSCVYDTFNVFQGVVIDSKTKKPIAGATIATIINGKVNNNYSLITDTMNIFNRKEYIKRNGNIDNWEETDEGNFSRKMQRKGPLLTDSLGFFKLIISTGLPIPVKFIVMKFGYSSIITKEMKSSQDTIEVNLPRIK
jgi:hypothetical protein